jgi:DNA replication protein DnaC
MKIQIKGRIFQGKTINERAEGEIHHNTFGAMQIKKILNYPYMCSRCQKNDFYISLDGDDYLIFCSTPICMSEDAEFEKSIVRKEYQKQKERNQYGQIMTGAEKFSLGARFKNASLSSVMMDEENITKIYIWMKNLQNNLIYLGNPGCGKTYVLSAILNYLFEQKKEVFYSTHRKFIKYIQDGISEEKSQYQLLNKIALKEILLFDDLGSASNTEWQKEMILELIDIRYAQKLPTIYTSNLSKEEVSNIFGSRTSSRLFAKENSTIEIRQQDLRQIGH